MASNGHSIVDLTDDSDTSGMASTPSKTSHHFNNYADASRSSYVASASNPAKRSRIDNTDLNRIALLKPNKYLANGSSPANPDIQSLHSRAKQEMVRPLRH